MTITSTNKRLFSKFFYHNKTKYLPYTNNVIKMKYINIYLKTKGQRNQSVIKYI